MSNVPSQLSKNFHITEFLNSAGITIKPTKEQSWCLYILANKILQPIRDTMGSMRITSGLRNSESNEKLIKQGYPASKTSDHFAWSSVNPRGTGAADFTCPDVGSMEIVFKWIISNLNDKYRQVIYYPDMKIIHVSNSFNLIFTMDDDISSSNRILIKKNGEGFKSYQ